jgi:hypothetical protein
MIHCVAKANNLPIMGSVFDESQLKMRLSQGWTILMTGANATPWWDVKTLFWLRLGARWKCSTRTS